VGKKYGSKGYPQGNAAHMGNCSPHHKFEFNNAPHFNITVVQRAPSNRATIICSYCSVCYMKLTKTDTVFSLVFIPSGSSIEEINTILFYVFIILLIGVIFNVFK
jgi:hypothetical protein